MVAGTAAASTALSGGLADSAQPGDHSRDVALRGYGGERIAAGNLVDGIVADEEEGEEEEDEEAEGGEGEDDEAGARVISEWWGLGGEAREAPYLGLAELGVTLLAVGLVGYSAGKRTGVLPVRFRRYLLPAHEWTMLAGTALTGPHFLAVEEWEGLGVVLGLLLGVEILSGLYGRHLHRHVIRLGRGDEPASLVGRLVEMSKATMFSRWRRIHVSLTVLTAVVLVLHVVTAVGD